MILAVIVYIVVITGLGYYLTDIKHNAKGYWFILAYFLILIPIMNNQIGTPAPEEYNYQTYVHTTYADHTIYFKEYTQIDNTVYIDDYCVFTPGNWFDFNRYYRGDKQLVITLIDNDNRFQYRDRFDNKEYNKPVQIERAIQ